MVSTSCLQNGRGAILYNPDRSAEFSVNPVGLFIWKHLDGQTPVPAIVRDIAEAFEGAPPGEVEREATDFLDSAVTEGFAQKSPAPFAEALANEDFPRQGDGPTSLELSLTGKCNLACKYCFFADEMKVRPDLPREEWFKFFGEIKSLAVRQVSLSGGEIFTRPDLMEIIDGVVAARLRYDLLSNGGLINEKTLADLSIPQRRNRFNGIQISIDGGSAEVHDKSRGPGSFVGAVRAMKLLREAGFPVSCRVTVNRYNVDDLENIARFLLEEIGLPSFSTNDAVPLGAGCHNQNDIALTNSQKHQAINKLVQLSKNMMIE